MSHGERAVSRQGEGATVSYVRLGESKERVVTVTPDRMELSVPRCICVVVK
jgi:hypothetical protein